MKKRVLLVIFALVAGMIMASCTTERSALDKTSDLTLDKKLFEGEFFYRQTIVHLPYTSNFSFIGESSDGAILKWKITKNWLIAYNVHDKREVVNTEEEPVINETPVLSFPIYQHFDILPAQNPTTGEDTPVLVPNTDRPWNERRYFVIDQSRNGTTNFSLKYLRLTEEWGAPYMRTGLTDAKDFEFYAHDGTYINPKDYRTMLANESKNEKEVEWFQFTTEEYLNPVNSWAGIYSMEDVEEFIGNEPMRITYRHIFYKMNRDVYGQRTYDPKAETWVWKKGKKDNGFRPLVYNDELFRRFGFFRNTFRGYDPKIGVKDKDQYTMANYFNIAWGLKTNKKDKDGNIIVKWNLTCDKGQGTVDGYNKCLAEKVTHQQKIRFTYSSETPKRILPLDCAIAKDYNHAMLGARFAAMNPGSDTREFEKWYVATYKDDFFKTVKGVDGKEVKIRDEGWYMHLDQYKDWASKCFFKDSEASVQDWNGDLIGDKDPHINDIVVMVDNPVESYVPARDRKHQANYGNYDGYNKDTNENALYVCIPKADADKIYNDDPDMKKVHYLDNCEKNDKDMADLYTKTYGRDKWYGDRYDCKLYDTDENNCSDKDFVKFKAACVLTPEKTCKVEKTGRPLLRHKYNNGDLLGNVALLNWVDEPTDYGILGVSQWNANPETGQSLSAGSNIAGSVLEWVMTRAIELAKMTMDPSDPAAWDWHNITNPDYAHDPNVKWNNDPEEMQEKAFLFKRQQRFSQMDDATRKDLIQNTLKKYQMPKYHNRFDYSAIRGSKWETKMTPPSLRATMFPWKDALKPDYTDPMNDMLETFYNPEKLRAEMMRMVARGEATYFNSAFLDGTTIDFIKERQSRIKKEMNLPSDISKWSSSQRTTYIKKLTDAIFYDLERLEFKGVAIHEMGHSFGLRHNFISSADQTNYKDEYFAPRNYPALRKKIKEYVEKEEAAGVDDSMIGQGVHRLIQGFQSDIKKYEYVSVMDYQREPYIHAVGLGKYDLAAFKFVYGRSVEQYKMVTADDIKKNNKLKESDLGKIAYDTTNPLRDPAYPFPILINRPYLDKDGKLKTIYDAKGKAIDSTVPCQRKLITYWKDGKKYQQLVADVKTDLYNAPIIKKDASGYELNEQNKYFVNDGSMHKYLFFSDETRMSEPASNVFDKYNSAREIIRDMVDSDEAYYFLRYFRRGNPRFREFRGRTSIAILLGTMQRNYKFVHFLLDLNYNAFKRGWLGKMLIGGTMSYPLGKDIDSTTISFPNKYATDYTNAIEGKEYWIKDGKLQELTPMGPGDYLVAGMVGINHLLYDIIYSPDAEQDYVRISPKKAGDGKSYAYSKPYNVLRDKIEIDKGQQGYWTTSGYLGLSEEDNSLEKRFMKGGVDGEIGLRYGKILKNHWDKQDDPSVYYKKVIYKGFELQKMIAIYTIANSGWFSEKYRMESMANSIAQSSDGLKHVEFALLTDIANEDSLISMSPYCYDTKENKVVKVNLPVNSLLTFLGGAPFLSSEGHDLPTNLCAYYSEHTKEADDSRYEPIRAGWIYFDKMWPLYWAMGGVANTSADTSILLNFYTFTYPSYKKDQYPAPDVNEVATINTKGNMYFRAMIPSDTLTEEDRADLLWWKQAKKAGMSDEYALCERDSTNHCKMNGSNPVVRKIWVKNVQVGTDSNDNPVMGDVIVTRPELQTSSFAQEKELTKKFYTEYLRKKYARFCPAFNLVWSLSKVNGGENQLMNNDKPASNQTIMETTLMQMNSFVSAHFSEAVQYIWY